MNSNNLARNARWTAIETSTRGRSSNRLRQLLLHQDLSRGDSTSRLDSSAHTMPIPAIRRTSYGSIESIGSMSSVSSLSSIGSMSNRRYNSRKTSSSKLVRYHNSDSRNSLLSLNTRWKSTPTKKRNSPISVNTKLLKASVLSPIARNGRWMATVSSDSAIDRPISVIKRKASHNTIMPSST